MLIAFLYIKIAFLRQLPRFGQEEVNLKLLFHSVPPDHQPCDRQKKPDEGHEEIENNAGQSHDFAGVQGTGYYGELFAQRFVGKEVFGFQLSRFVKAYFIGKHRPESILRVDFRNLVAWAFCIWQDDGSIPLIVEVFLYFGENFAQRNGIYIRVFFFVLLGEHILHQFCKFIIFFGSGFIGIDFRERLPAERSDDGIFDPWISYIKPRNGYQQEENHGIDAHSPVQVIIDSLEFSTEFYRKAFF